MDTSTRVKMVVCGVALVSLSTVREAIAQCDGPCPCPPGQVCTPVPCSDGSGIFTDCTTQAAPFTPTMDTWTYLFDGNNAIKIGTTVIDPFLLKVDMIKISQTEYKARRDDSQFANTVCNPSFAPGITDDCVFYRVHGETVLRTSYGETVDYKIFWNFPTMQGNKHDWMLLRAPCDDSTTDTEHPPCFTDPLFSENTTNFVDRKPPVGTDPIVAGDSNGFSDYIVAISNDHPHKDIPATIP
jgi:hypothetical protein